MLSLIRYCALTHLFHGNSIPDRWSIVLRFPRFPVPRFQRHPKPTACPPKVLLPVQFTKLRADLREETQQWLRGLLQRMHWREITRRRRRVASSCPKTINFIGDGDTVTPSRYIARHHIHRVRSSPILDPHQSGLSASERRGPPAHQRPESESSSAQPRQLMDSEQQQQQ